MKNFYLSLSVLLFSTLLIGCGMKGPLYQAPDTEKQVVDKKNMNETEENEQCD